MAKKNYLSATKWTLGITGLLLIILGLILFFNPISTFVVSSIIAGVILLISAVFYLISFFANLKSPEAGWMLISAILSFLVGWILMVNPGLSIAILIFVIGIWAIALGATHFANSFALRQFKGSHWGWHLVGGILMILMGMVIIFNPFVGLVATDYLIAFFMIFYGLMGIFGAFYLNSSVKELSKLY